MTNDGSHTYVYDALNHKVSAKTGSSTLECVFDAAGRVTSNWPSQTYANEGHIFWDGVKVAVRSQNGLTFFEHKDWLQTDRMQTDPTGAVAATYMSLPFGDGGSASISESYAGWDFNHFGDMDYNAESATHHAQFRQYNDAQGRWMRPDPYYGSYDPSNPQSMNRYAYVLNAPLGFIDPSGLEGSDSCIIYTDSDGNVVSVQCAQGSGGGGGGCSSSNPLACGWTPQPGSNYCLTHVCFTFTGSGGGGGGGGSTTPSNAQKSPQRQQCESDAAAKYAAAAGSPQHQFNTALAWGALTGAAAGAYQGATKGAIAGCVLTSEVGCWEGAVSGGVLGAIWGGVGGAAGAALPAIGNIIWTQYQASKQYNQDMQTCSRL